MYRQWLILGVLVGFALIMPAAALADSGCCKDKACCEKMATCCKQEGRVSAVDILLNMAQPNDQREEVKVAPARQTAVVWFHRPVRVGDRYLFGKYIIEHDNDRMARGRPCTHIYDASDTRLPVVAFHCRHLTRKVASRDLVVLRPLGDGLGTSTMTEFQFAGDTAAHGVPVIR